MAQNLTVNYRKLSTDRARQRKLLDGRRNTTVKRLKGSRGLVRLTSKDGESSEEPGDRTQRSNNSHFFSFDKRNSPFDTFLRVPSAKQTSTDQVSKDSNANKEQIEDLNRKIKAKITQFSMNIIDRVINNNKFLSIKRDLYPEQYPEPEVPKQR